MRQRGTEREGGLVALALGTGFLVALGAFGLARSQAGGRGRARAGGLPAGQGGRARAVHHAARSRAEDAPGETPPPAPAEQPGPSSRHPGEGAIPHPLPETDPPQGREADQPEAIPLAGWRRILIRTYAAVAEDRVLAVAAGVTFYLLLAMVPAITAFVSIYGIFAARETVTGHLALLEGVVPPEIMPVIEEQLTRIAGAGATTMTLASIFAILVALWSANSGTKALIEALNIAYDEMETRSFVRLTLISLGLTLAGVALGLVMIGAVVVLPAVMAFLPETGAAGQIGLWLRWPLLVVVMMGALAVLYRFAPDRRAARWRWVSPGALVAALALIPFSLGFSFYAARFADFNGTYGSLGALMGFLLWLWILVVIVLMGAELNAEAEKQTNRDTTTGPARPMGQREAEAADVVAP